MPVSALAKVRLYLCWECTRFCSGVNFGAGLYQNFFQKEEKTQWLLGMGLNSNLCAILSYRNPSSELPHPFAFCHWLHGYCKHATNRTKRPILSGDDYSRGSLEVEVLVERCHLPTLAASRTLSAASRQQQLQQQLRPPGVTAVGPAAIASIDSDVRNRQHFKESALLYCNGMETGGIVDRGWQNEEALEGVGTEEELSCTLMDTVTGERFPLDAAGSPADWQMGLPPADARRERREQHRGFVGCVGENIDGRLFFDIRRDYDAEVHGVASGAGISRTPAATTKSIRLFRLDRVPGSVRAWSAEDPQLYTLVVELRIRNALEEDQEEGVGVSAFSQFESAKIGFRSVLVRSGQLLVNGRAVMLAGVNRHEHDPNTGKTVSEESMIQDIVTMKR